MSKHGPTEADTEALADAMCQVLNELAHGNSVCDLVKARARIAMQPFLLDDNGDLPDLEWAERHVASYEGREEWPSVMDHAETPFAENH